MLIKQDFETAQSVDTVWDFFGDIPQVAACLPGAELTDEIGEDHYKGIRSSFGWDPSSSSSMEKRRSRNATTPTRRSP